MPRATCLCVSCPSYSMVNMPVHATRAATPAALPRRGRMPAAILRVTHWVRTYCTTPETPSPPQKGESALFLNTPRHKVHVTPAAAPAAAEKSRCTPRRGGKKSCGTHAQGKDEWANQLEAEGGARPHRKRFPVQGRLDVVLHALGERVTRLVAFQHGPVPPHQELDVIPFQFRRTPCL